MISKKHLRNKYDDDFEKFMSTTPPKDKPRKKEKSQMFWKNSDDESSSSLQHGDNKRFLKTKKPNDNLEETLIPSIEYDMNNRNDNDLKLDLNDYSTEKSDIGQYRHFNNNDEDGFPHPITFEGITEQSYLKNKTTKTADDQDINERYDNNINNTNFSLTANSINDTKDDPLLLKVSLIDSNEYGSRADKGNSNQANLTSNDPNERFNNKLDGASFSFNKSSLNPASGDSYNNTQGITNITDTVIGETTAADLAAINRQFQTMAEDYDTNFDGKSNNYDYRKNDVIDSRNVYNKVSTDIETRPDNNESDTGVTNSFGLKTIRLDELERDQSSSPTPTPRHKRMENSIANNEFQYGSKTYQIAQPKSMDLDVRPKFNPKINTNHRKKYSHVDSSGYGVKIPKKPTDVNSKISSQRPSRTPQINSARNSNKKPSQPMPIRHKSYEPRKRKPDILEVSFSDRDTSIQDMSYYDPLKSQEWREKWLEERRMVKKLQADSNIQERDFNRRLESITQKYENQISELEKSLTYYKQRTIPDLSNKEPSQSVTKEDLKKIQQEIKEQEALIAGYQKENERLYETIKNIKCENKSKPPADNIENERLISQIVSLKAELESKEIEIKNLRKMNQDFRQNGRTTGEDHKDIYIEQISQLKSELKQGIQRNMDVESEKLNLEKKMDKILGETDKLICHLQSELEIERIEKEKLKDSHSVEVKDLKKKIKWYLENQVILDKESKKVKDKDNQISELKRQLETSDHIKISSNIRAKERHNDAVRIKKLEDDNLSLKEDMYALMKNKNIGHIVEKRSVQFLEEKIKSLEKDKEESVEKENRSLRSLQQQFEGLKSQYEDKIRDLEFDLMKLPDKNSKQEKENRLSELRAKIEMLTKQINQKNSTIQKLKTDIKALKPEDMTNLKQNPTKKSNIRRIEVDNKVQILEKQLQDKEIELQRIQIQNHYLKSMEKSDNKQFRTNLEIEAENSSLKSQLAHIQYEFDKFKQMVEQERSDYELGQQNMKQDYENKLQQLELYHRDNLQNVKMDFANRCSQSDLTGLKSQIEMQKGFIDHLQNQIQDYSEKFKDYNIKVRDLESAQHHIQSLESELKDLRVIWTNKPGLEMIERLRAKISLLEEKENTKGRYIEEYTDKVVKSKCQTYEEEIEKLKSVVLQKNQSLLKVQLELSHLLEALEELRRQGISIPRLTSQQYSRMCFDNNK